MGTNKETLDSLIEKAADLVVSSSKIIVFTGAGVSTESGIPDFRSPGGVWSKYDPEDFTIQKFLRDSEARRKHWQMLTESGLLQEAQPNPAHYAVAELEKLGKLRCVITQNVDNLHQKAGNSPEKVFELHGNMRWVKCLGCGRREPIQDTVKTFKETGTVPDCAFCHGILKPEGIFFGEALPSEVLSKATYYSHDCSLFFVLGSTLVVYPAAYMPYYAKKAGAKLIIINLSPTPMDQEATVLIHAKAGETMPTIVEYAKQKLVK